MNSLLLKNALVALGDPAGLGALGRALFDAPLQGGAAAAARLCEALQVHLSLLPLKHVQVEGLAGLAQDRAALALGLSRFFPNESVADLLAACVLLDVGKAALDAVSPSGVHWTYDPAGPAAATALDEETRALGADHAVVGKWVLEHWGLPMRVAEAVWLHHHRPSTIGLTAEQPRLCFSVMLVDALADARRCGNVVAPSAWIEQLAERLQLDGREVFRLVQPDIVVPDGDVPSLEAWQAVASEPNRLAALVAMHERLHGARKETDVLAALAWALRDGLGAPQGECAGQEDTVAWSPGHPPTLSPGVAMEVPNVAHAMALPIGTADESLGQIWVALPAPGVLGASQAMEEARRLVETCAQVLRRLRQDERNTARLEGLTSALHAAEAAHARELERDRLESLSRFAAGAAHEINNPLAVISGRAQLLVSQASSPEHIRALETIVAQSRRISKIVNDLMQFARPTGTKSAIVGVPYLMHQVLAPMRERLAQRGIQIVERFVENLPRVRVDRHQLERGLINALLNAEQAMQDTGGTLTVEGQVGAGGAVEILLRDTGPGIAPEHLGRVFDPFFTTRESQGGSTGLGLTVCRSVVEAHGGRVTLSSRVGEGAVLKIALPAAESVLRAQETVVATPVQEIPVSSVVPAGVEGAVSPESTMERADIEPRSVEPVVAESSTAESPADSPPPPVVAAVERVFNRSAAVLSARSAAPPAVVPAQGRILIVEENEDLREVLRAALAARGYETDVTPDGLEGLASALAHTPALIVCATRLSGVDTVTLIRQVRQRVSNMPIVVIAGPGNDEEAAEALQAGAKAVLHKPFDFERLMQEISRFLVAQHVA